jgi:hypothetical protein
MKANARNLEAIFIFGFHILNETILALAALEKQRFSKKDSLPIFLLNGHEPQDLQIQNQDSALYMGDTGSEVFGVLRIT